MTWNNLLFLDQNKDPPGSSDKTLCWLVVSRGNFPSLSGTLTFEGYIYASGLSLIVESFYPNTDARVERNALMSQVYPKLRDFCHEKGYEFQVVDMRWGIHDPCTDDPMFSEVLLEELNLCQELSTGPNFVVSNLNRYHSFVAFFSPFISFF